MNVYPCTQDIINAAFLYLKKKALKFKKSSTKKKICLVNIWDCEFICWKLLMLSLIIQQNMIDDKSVVLGN